MTDEKRMISLIGKDSDSPEVTAWLAELGAPAPILETGDFDVPLSVPDKGIEINFKDEAYRSKRKDLAIGEGALVLVAIQLRSSVRDYKDYQGPLFKGLVFGDTPLDVHKKLGPPGRVHPRMPVEFWMYDDLQLAVTYDKAKTGVKEVSLGEPVRK